MKQVITLLKLDKDPKFPQNLRPISLLSTRGKLFEKVTLQIVKRHIEERGLLSESQFGFCPRYSTALPYVRLMDITLNFNNNISTAAVFLDIEKGFDATWHLGLLYKLSELKFSISLIKLIRSFLSQRNIRVLVKGEMSMPRDVRVQAGVPQDSIVFSTLYTIYKKR
jgi:hypothetical protein